MITNPTHRIAVGAYIFDDRQRILLLLRNGDPRVFAPPGGKLETGESPLDGIVREVREEAGIEIDLLEPAFIWYGRIFPKSPDVITIDFIATAKTTGVKISDEHSDYAWATFEEVVSQKYTTIENGFGYDPKNIVKAFGLYKQLIGVQQ
jgi:8-oxo-dGTP diphosphatase